MNLLETLEIVHILGSNRSKASSLVHVGLEIRFYPSIFSILK